MSEKGRDEDAESTDPNIKPLITIHGGSLGLRPCKHTEERCLEENGYFVIYCAHHDCNEKKVSYSFAYAQRMALLLEALRLHNLRDDLHSDQTK
jgi:hypothetical protein